jgi:CMP-N,N'-diacetyllegionaminic acid synthase
MDCKAKIDKSKHLFYGLIPARSGSKGIINKNIKDFNGKPLMNWSINASNNSSYISRTFISTDSNEYGIIAKECGAEVLRLRPLELADDLSTDYECLIDFIEQLKENNIQLPNAIVQLRPTFPNRNSQMIDIMISEFDNNWEGYDSFRTVIPVEKTPFKMYTIQDGSLNPIVKQYKSIHEPYNQPRQILPQTYLHNGCVDIIKTKTIIKKHSITGNAIYPYVMHEKNNDDIDSECDFNKALLKSSLYYEEKNDDIEDEKYHEDEKTYDNMASTGRLPINIDLDTTIRTLRVNTNFENNFISAKSAEVREGNSTHKS